MSPTSFLSYFCIVSLLFNGCLAQIEQVGGGFQQTGYQSFQGFGFGGQPRARRQQRQQLHDCKLDRINACEPARRVESEAGFTEVWDENDEQFQCAGVVFMRHNIRPRGLLLPEFSNSPRLFYVLRGRGIQQTVFPGCPETYQSFEGAQQMRSQQSRRFAERQSERQGFRDQHQKVRPLREGDVLAVPQGAAQWIYNNGQEDLVVVFIVDTSNPENQLDEHHRKFFLAGNPQQQLQSQRELECEREGQCEMRERFQRSRQSRRSRSEEERNGNVFSGFDERILAESLNVNPDLARRLRSENDFRGIIVFVQEELGLISPEFSEEGREEEQERQLRRGGRRNGIEETCCTGRLRFNINNPQRADLFNPRAGRVTTCNSLNLPVLAYLQLSAEKGVLYDNAIMGPNWNLNAHSIIYITRGNGRIQIVNDNGQPVFDGQVQENQVIVAPQNFPIVKKAGSQGLEWISFKTNDQAKISQLAGRLSALRAMPVEVVANSFQVSVEEARRIKQNREEVTLFSPTTTSQRY